MKPVLITFNENYYDKCSSTNFLSWLKWDNDTLKIGFQEWKLWRNICFVIADEMRRDWSVSASLLDIEIIVRLFCLSKYNQVISDWLVQI